MSYDLDGWDRWLCLAFYASMLVVLCRRYCAATPIDEERP